MVIQIRSSLFTGQFRDSFASTGVSPELISIIIWVLTISGSILAVGILVQFLRRQFHPHKSVERLDDSRKIIDLLGHCLAERSRFEISFKEKLLKTRGIFCSLVSVNPNEILLEVPDYVTVSDTWIGRSLDVYFSMTLRGNTRTFYTFESLVASIDREDAGGVYLHIPLPQAVRLGQRRMHFRLVPATATILETKIWFAEHESRAADHAQPAKWGQPMAHHHLLTMETTEHSLTIMDLSAGGCRLSVKNTPQINAYLAENRSPDVFLFFRLLDRESGNLEVYLLGKIRVIVCDPMNKTRSLGIEFIMHGEMGEGNGQSITWTPLTREEGHPEIGNWVFKQHLELFRQQEKDKQEDV
jgi:c-di-GMP-binding flagellar brake protein YcgR